MTLRATALVALLMLPTHAVAQPLPADPPATEDEATDLIGRGLGMMLDHLMNEMGPDLDALGDDMSGALSQLAPMLDDLSVLVDDLANYQAPERLENGDVIIRRKPGAPLPPPLGDNLRPFAEPDGTAPARDPSQPEISL